MSDAENPTTEREAEKPATPSSKKDSRSTRRRATAADGSLDKLKRCTACRRKQSSDRKRCISCGAALPDKTLAELAKEDSAEGLISDEKPIDEKPAEVKPAAGGAGGRDAPQAAEKPVEVKPADTKPAAEKAAEATPATEKAADAKPTEPSPAPVTVPQAAEKTESRPAEPTQQAPPPVSAPVETPAPVAETPTPEAAREALQAEEVTLEALLLKATQGVAPVASEVAPPPTEAKKVTAPPPAERHEKEPAHAREHAPAPTETPAAAESRHVTPAVKKPATAPVRPPAPNPPVNVGAVVKTELAPVAKTLEHLGDQVKAGLTLIAKGQRAQDEKVTLVARAVEELAKDAQKRRKDYDALYAEMRGYKENFLETAQKPLFNALVLLFDAVDRIMRRVDEIPDAAIPKDAVTEAFRQVKDQLVESLYRNDIELIEDRPAKLDVSFQKPVRRVETETAAEDRDVVQCVREGFRRRGIVFRPQEVVVKRCLAVSPDGGAHDTTAPQASGAEPPHSITQLVGPAPTEGATPAEPETPRKEEL